MAGPNPARGLCGAAFAGYNGPNGRSMTNVYRQRGFGRLCALAGLCVLPAMAPLGGCYSYVAADLAAVPVGGHVRAVVDATTADRLHATYGVAGATLDGRVVERADDVLTLSLPSVPLGSPLGTHPLYQQVPVAAADVVGVQVRRLNAFKTGALLAAGATAATVIAVRALSGTTGGTSSGTTGGPTESVRPWAVRVAIPLP